ncbi:hypothetical protein Y032_0045g1143 [Ancylostoma ceylanicum]|nr:hypothetical protein Y032_0045g1143 [Ancylostoma ceylanicum]
MFWFLDDLFVNQCTWKTCCQRNTMYLVTCEGCGQKYIGETSRPLYKRLDEQLRVEQRWKPPARSDQSYSSGESLHIVWT